MKYFSIMLITVFFFACETVPTSMGSISKLPLSFTTENIMKVHQGMSANQILTMFGAPKSVSQSVCGGADAWNCTTWEYGAFPYDRASFTFNGNTPDSLILNNFSIERK